MKMIGRILLSIVLIIALVGLLGCLFVTFTEGNMLPGFLSVAAYPVDKSDYPDFLPVGSAAVIKKGIEAGDRDFVIVEDENGYSAGVVMGEGDDRTVTVGGETLPFDGESRSAAGRVYYRINGLGGLAKTLRQHRVWIWIAMGVIAILAALAIFTTPARKRRAEVKRLIELFDYYGRKFDEEDRDIDY